MTNKIIEWVCYLPFIHNSAFIYNLYANTVNKLRLYKIPVMVFGNKMLVDDRDASVIMLRRIHEPITTNLVREVIQNGWVTVDVGANIGYYTLIFSELTGRSGKVYSFEPLSQFNTVLEKNIKMNNLENVELVKKGLSDINGRAKAGASVIDVIRLDDHLKNASTVNFIKIDIEGMEHHAVNGMRQIISGNNVIVLSEFWPEALKNNKVDPPDYLNTLTELGLMPLIKIDESCKKIELIDGFEGLLEMKYPVNIVSLKKTNDEEIERLRRYVDNFKP